MSSYFFQRNSIGDFILVFTWLWVSDVVVPKLEYALDTIGSLGGFDHKFESPEEVSDVINGLTATACYFPGKFPFVLLLVVLHT